DAAGVVDGRGIRMKRPGRVGIRWWRAIGPAALLVSLALPQVAVSSPLVVAAAAALPGRPDLSTYAGAPAAGKPTEVAQQPFGLAVLAAIPLWPTRPITSFGCLSTTLRWPLPAAAAWRLGETPTRLRRNWRDR